MNRPIFERCLFNFGVLACLAASACTQPALAEAQPAASQPADPVAAEAAARKTLDEWLSAQNRGDFAAYQRLFAERFQGVRRSGPRTRVLTRKAWIADRQRMFQKPMKVSMRGLAVTSLGGMVQARFIQTWESGTYHDEGPKAVSLVNEKGAWRIAREEMLASKIDAKESGGAASMAQVFV
ncbi:MAG TPA: nuclear transport factor 2 family protein, partial [Polyangia bacterium]